MGYYRRVQERQETVKAWKLGEKMALGEHWNVLDADSRSQPQTRFTIPDAVKNVSLNELMGGGMGDCYRADKEASYLLISEEGALTGFHQDFSSTSVVYVLLKGCKTFYLVRPSRNNQKMFNTYLAGAQRDIFFGSHTHLNFGKCQKVTLKARQAVCMPAGMIHFVETTGTSVALGQ